jgi:hypothetical protein
MREVSFDITQVDDTKYVLRGILYIAVVTRRHIERRQNTIGLLSFLHSAVSVH